MRILLDTHILLWALSNDARLPDKARQMILHPENEICYSILSLWEVEIKHMLHPEELTITAGDLDSYCKRSGYSQISLRANHIDLLETLHRGENAPPHKDPFDRMLICQSIAENMLFISHDQRIAEYTAPCILAV